MDLGRRDTMGPQGAVGTRRFRQQVSRGRNKRVTSFPFAQQVSLTRLQT